MSIPLATTTVTVARRDQTADGYDSRSSDATPLSTGVRAHFGSPSGRTDRTTGIRTDLTWRLNTDPTDLQAADLVTDDSTGVTYEVIWAQPRSAFGLDHIEASVRTHGGAR